MATLHTSTVEKHPVNTSMAQDTTPIDSKSDIVQETLKGGAGEHAHHIEDGEKSAKYEQYLNAGLSDEDARFLIGFTKKEERAIYRKVDYRLVPLLSLLYLISHLDRANIGNVLDSLFCTS